MLQVYLVRHGETEWNVARRIQGQSDSPLTEVGIRQAKLVAEKVKSIDITHIISSDLGRTQKRGCRKRGEFFSTISYGADFLFF